MTIPLIGLTGPAGVGKSSLAEALRRRGFAIVAFSDALKSVICGVFGTPEDVLYGPSERRGEPVHDDLSATVRIALQTLGDWGRILDPDCWVRIVERRVNWLRDWRLAELLFGAPTVSGAMLAPAAGTGPLQGHRGDDGTIWPGVRSLDAEGCIRGVVVVDVRLPNEAAMIRRLGGKVVQLQRATVRAAPPGGLPDHATEMPLPETLIDTSWLLPEGGDVDDVARVYDAVTDGVIEWAAGKATRA